MESENQDFSRGLFGQQEELFLENDFSGGDDLFTVADHSYSSPEKVIEDWILSTRFNDSESEDVLHTIINPNDVYSSAPPAESSESDSGISDDQPSDSPQHSDTSQPESNSAAIYEVVYDIGALDGIKTEPVQDDLDVISIKLDDWSTPVLIPDACIVNELPGLTTLKTNTLPASVSASIPFGEQYPELVLTEEEKRLLCQEGISLPSNLPLTKAEERILKKVRRKIRNKQSAQDSRRRKKEYIDGLESRVTACSLQNMELHKKVEQLEKQNISLVAQLRKLQSLIKQTTNKAAQTGTCILIFIFSLALILFPSYSPLRSRTAVHEDDYKPMGVIFRTILNDPEASKSAEADKSSFAGNQIPIELTQQEEKHNMSINKDLPNLQVSKENDGQLLVAKKDGHAAELIFQGIPQNESSGAPQKAVPEVDETRVFTESGNGEHIEELSSQKGQGPSVDTLKPVHADEM